jgi:hypothetical protein
MSRWLNHADLLQAYLETVVSVPVIVDRKLDLASSIAQSVAKAGGAAVIILWEGAKNPDTSSRQLRMGGRYSVLCITRPIIAGDAITCDDLTEQVASAMHDWVDSETPNHAARRLVVTEIGIQPSPNLRIYEISAEVERLPVS